MSSWGDSPSLTWFITGAASGFGLALARKALSQGHRVIATSRNPSKVPELVAEVEGSGNGRWLALDVDGADNANLIERLEGQEGERIDVLVNNAGWSLHGPAESFTEDEVRRQMETMYFGPYRLIRAAVPHMRRRRRGLVLNIGSGAGPNGRPSMAVYGASKSAMDGLMRIMAKELAPFNVRTLNVLLGAFDTSFVSAITITKTPLPEDYKGSMVEAVLSGLTGKSFDPDGDHKKAVEAMYQVVMGEGPIGAGKEKESVMLLGKDMWESMVDLHQQQQHYMDTFQEVCNSVSRDR